MSGALKRVVIDTNVLLDFWVFDNTEARPLASAIATGALLALRSSDTLDELIDVLARPQFRLTPVQQQQLLNDWQQQAQHIARVFSMQLACSDPHDQKFIDLALSAHADALITKDKALLKLSRRARRLEKPLAILTPVAAAGCLNSTLRI